jgi:hypothetical protein
VLAEIVMLITPWCVPALIAANAALTVAYVPVAVPEVADTATCACRLETIKAIIAMTVAINRNGFSIVVLPMILIFRLTNILLKF